MDELQRLLDELGSVFDLYEGYFRTKERLTPVVFQDRVAPILRCVVRMTRRLLDQHYVLSAEETDTSSVSASVELVHYTDLASLVSILGGTSTLNSYAAVRGTRTNDKHPDAPRETSTIRLYDTEHFNDPDEGEYTVRSLRLFEKYQWLERRNPGHAYIASFIRPNGNSDNRDNLVYWRTYGNDGEGCSIVVSVPKDSVRTVLYGRPGLSHIHNVAITVLDRLDRIVVKNKLKGEILSELSKAVWNMLLPALFLHKSDAYSYERECRFLEPWDYGLGEEVLFEYEEISGANPRIRHYIERAELDACQVLVSGTCITLGPRVEHRRSAKMLLERLLKTSGLQHTQVRFSEIAYRGTRR